MIARYERPVSLAARWARRVSLFAFALFVAAALMHRFASLDVRNFLSIGGLAAGLAVLGLLLGLIGFARLWMVGARGGWASLAAFILSAVVLLPVGEAGWLFLNRPEINDVSTDLASPPEWLVAPVTTMPAVAAPDGAADSVAAEVSPVLVGRHYEGGVDRVQQAVRAAIRETGMTVVREAGTHARVPVPSLPPTQGGTGPVVDPGGVHTGRIPVPRDRPSPLAVSEPPEARTARIQALYRTMVFGLKSDVVIRLRENEEMTTVDMRVASRFGPSDLGCGTMIIQQFFRDLDRDLLGVAQD